MPIKRSKPIVAIDGPAGSGKSTIAKMLAKKLNYIHVDTGALYRAVGYLTLEKEVDSNDQDAVGEALSSSHIEFKSTEQGNRLFLNAQDISDKIRTEEVSMLASKVSAYSCVRAGLLGIQRSLGKKGGTVIEGRDIGTVVFPDAEAKIFLTASKEERAKRRVNDLAVRGEKADYETVLADLVKRDHDDSTRKHAPLKKADDAQELDTSGLSIEQVLDKMVAIVQSKEAEMRA